MQISRPAFMRGMRHGLPLVVVVVPFAALFGLLASEAGLRLYEILLFSTVVFAGASQFAALHMLQDHVPVAIILVTALAINLRMLMYSVALTPYLGGAGLGVRAIAAFLIVDQSFALAVSEYEKRPEMSTDERLSYFFGTIVPITIAWLAAIAAGALLGRTIPAEYGLDFAMPITFLALAGPMMRTMPHVFAAVVSVTVTLALHVMPYGTGLLVGAAAGMAAGALAETMRGAK